MIATRTRDALSRAKARGVKLRGPKLAQARRAAVEVIEANANRHAADVLPIIRERFEPVLRSRTRQDFQLLRPRSACSLVSCARRLGRAGPPPGWGGRARFEHSMR
jgi:hypothetical protein